MQSNIESKQIQVGVGDAVGLDVEVGVIIIVEVVADNVNEEVEESPVDMVVFKIASENGS